jgi:small subunit ribosomal protein S20e
MVDAKEKIKGEESLPKSRVRMTLTCKNRSAVEKVCRELIKRAKDLPDVKATGPVRMPTKVLAIHTRKSPCGEGTNTYEKWEMKIYKRVIDLFCTSSDIKEITSIKIDAGVEIELILKDEDEE